MNEPVVAFVSQYLDLSEAEERALLELDLVRPFSKGETLAAQGEESEHSYFVLSGLIRCHRDADGVDRTLDFFSEGEVFEPPAVMERTPMAFHVSCVEDTLVCLGTPALEQEMMERFPRFGIVCQRVAEEFAQKRWRALQDFKLSTPRERYEALCRNRPDLVQRVPQYMIAGYLGIEPESLSRIRRRMVTG